MKHLLYALILITASVAANPTEQERLNPSLEAYVQASSLYESGQHQLAYEQFMVAARWGNKLAQFNLGTMHQNGHGVSRDPARAWAWVKLASERDYGQLVAIADALYAQLDAGDKARGTRIFNDELKPQLGDAVVLPAVQRYLDRQYRLATGSRLGGTGSTPLIVQPKDELQSVGDIYYAQDRFKVASWLTEEKRWFEAMTQSGASLGETHAP